MKQISWAEGIGYIASLLVFCTFYMKTRLPLPFSTWSCLR
jgi:hypothetical protein